MRHTFEIDNITWNDLSLEDIYSRLNSCLSSPGDDYLYDRLKNPYVEDCEELKEDRLLLGEFRGLYEDNGVNILQKLNTFLSTIGKLKKYNFKEEILAFSDAEKENNLSHYIQGLLVILSFILIFVLPGPGVVLFFVFIAISVSNYFKKKNIIAGRLTVFNYLIRMLKAIKKLDISEVPEEKRRCYKSIYRLKELSKIFEPFIRGTFVISEGARTTSSIFSIALDYIRMIFHVDIIKYNSMISFIKEHMDEVFELYDIIGKFDGDICIAKICSEKIVCDADIDICNEVLSIVDGYHLLIEEAVTNTICTNKNVLITGCNASGKSTFLKMVAINAILAQSFGICFAKEYRGSFYKIYSSMALKDDIQAKESYFMAEIKSLKRIVDEAAEVNIDSNTKVLCVIDEVLRGTNTVERIAASVEILSSFKKEALLCFVATHDIELTELLKDSYDNYHFEEEVRDGDVIFNYKINKGAANSRNAIRLLSVLGYDNSIVENAARRADTFISSGEWK